jgi:hypothetical protein
MLVFAPSQKSIPHLIVSSCLRGSSPCHYLYTRTNLVDLQIGDMILPVCSLCSRTDSTCTYRTSRKPRVLRHRNPHQRRSTQQELKDKVGKYFFPQQIDRVHAHVDTDSRLPLPPLKQQTGPRRPRSGRATRRSTRAGQQRSERCAKHQPS